MGEMKFDISKIEASGGNSPESMYLLFLLSLGKQWFEAVGQAEPNQIRRTMLAYISLACPDEEMRKAYWADYETLSRQRDSDDVVASVVVMGRVISTISESLGLHNKDFAEVF